MDGCNSDSVGVRRNSVRRNPSLVGLPMTVGVCSMHYGAVQGACIFESAFRVSIVETLVFWAREVCHIQRGVVAR